MLKTIYIATLTAALLAAPLPVLVQSSAAQSTAPAPAKTAKSEKPQSASQVALRDRQNKCGAEWKAAKTAGKIEKGMKWPQYWSACNKRLKAGG